ncbi:MAG: hypothetical protein V1661_01450 [bacterium]
MSALLTVYNIKIDVIARSVIFSVIARRVLATRQSIPLVIARSTRRSNLINNEIATP